MYVYTHHYYAIEFISILLKSFISLQNCDKAKACNQW